jgi:hypothetical protein
MNFEDIAKINIDISEENDKIYCKIQVPVKNSHFPYRIDIDSGMVRSLLKRKGHNPQLMLEGCRLSNKNPASRSKGTWVFQKIVKIKKKPSRAKTITKKTKE